MEEKYRIIEWLAKERVIENMISRMRISEHTDDLTQEIYLILLEYDSDTIIRMWEKNQINFFISRIISNQVFSKNSPFHYLYRKWDENKEEFISYELNDEDGD